MSSIVNPESRSRFQSSLFNAVVQDDFESMVKIYASQSCEAIASRFAMHQAVDSHRLTGTPKVPSQKISYVYTQQHWVGVSNQYLFRQPDKWIVACAMRY